MRNNRAQRWRTSTRGFPGRSFTRVFLQANPLSLVAEEELFSREKLRFRITLVPPAAPLTWVSSHQTMKKTRRIGNIERMMTDFAFANNQSQIMLSRYFSMILKKKSNNYCLDSLARKPREPENSNFDEILYMLGEEINKFRNFQLVLINDFKG